MPTLVEQQGSEVEPLYIRWSPDRAPYAVELRMEVVSRLVKVIDEAEKQGREVGGVLIGSFPATSMPVLRIEEFEAVPLGADDSGPVYMLDPEQLDRFAAVRNQARKDHLAAIGFFRSHIRPGPLRPSLADRSLLSGQFPQSVYAVLLIEAREPRLAAFFLAVNGVVPNDPSVREFRFDETEFKTLPELDETPPPQLAIPEPQKPEGSVALAARHNNWYKLVLSFLVLAGLICGFLWSLDAGLMGGFLRPAFTGWGLSLKESNNVLRISWNHSAPAFRRATEATLDITDGPIHRNLKLGLDDLTLGAVEYRTTNPQGTVVLTLNMPDATKLSQSAGWKTGE